ncbi:MAG: tetratricopeptide repeat protein [Xanthomonadales bacterium]|nr:tetratricopeptide repeat protein [Xanthomonadales bacterium]NIN73788.1 tetratricopeptide repeat protein [Xanthomonadales bacterium]NIO13765.1 tetratricopeptide repeat protein [Xanthomonadales bacterium]NIP10859.1 tetratricopeptide repeat protein [Xanthomonadales bacterium]NIQ34595.1 tetratricopeptide repeat protein [Xanthomonadales bacterium]
MGEEMYAEAREEILWMMERARERDRYLRAILHQALAQIQWALEDYDASLKSFEEAVGLDALPDQTHFSLMYQISQLYYMKQRYRDALDRLELWFCKSPPEQIKPEAYVLKASIYSQFPDWPEVVKAVDIAIGMAEQPMESWYLLKLAAHYEMNDYPAAGRTLETMIPLWPNKKQYWTQLSNVHFKLEEDDQALSVMALAYRNGLLDTQADILYLANLYAFREVPLKAAQVLQGGLDGNIVEPSEKHWTMAGDSWYAAEELEEALAAYENAGKVALDGDIDLRRGYILIDLERWDEARTALRAAVDKGGISERKMGDAYLMIGMSEFNLGNFDQASTAWGRASRYPRAKAAAEQWMNHLREERARRAS